VEALSSYGKPTMKKYIADIKLEVNVFDAASYEAADEIIDQYITKIASVNDSEIEWDSVNYTVTEVEEI